MLIFYYLVIKREGGGYKLTIGGGLVKDDMELLFLLPPLQNQITAMKKLIGLENPYL